jgi:hypothetical protein
MSKVAEVRRHSCLNRLCWSCVTSLSSWHPSGLLFVSAPLRFRGLLASNGQSEARQPTPCQPELVQNLVVRLDAFALASGHKHCEVLCCSSLCCSGFLASSLAIRSELTHHRHFGWCKSRNFPTTTTTDTATCRHFPGTPSNAPRTHPRLPYTYGNPVITFRQIGAWAGFHRGLHALMSDIGLQIGPARPAHNQHRHSLRSCHLRCAWASFQGFIRV